GVPCGVMDQLASAAGVAQHALLIDCDALSVEPVPMPDGASIVVVHSGTQRALVDSAYAQRRRSCERAAAIVGPLATASLEEIADAELRARARHVVTENQRVRDFAAALRREDLGACGVLMRESHQSLASDFAVSTPALDALVQRMSARPGVYGARLTGAGFGG